MIILVLSKYRSRCIKNISQPHKEKTDMFWIIFHGFCLQGKYYKVREKKEIWRRVVEIFKLSCICNKSQGYLEAEMNLHRHPALREMTEPTAVYNEGSNCVRKPPSDLRTCTEWARLTVKKKNLLAIGRMRRIQNACYTIVLEVDTGSLDLISAYGTCVRASYGFSPSKQLLAYDCHRDSVIVLLLWRTLTKESNNKWQRKYSTIPKGRKVAIMSK